jgi:RecA/RadA recombinase
MDEFIKQVRMAMTGNTPKIVKEKVYIPSGLTVLDLACTDDIAGAFQTGTYINIVGDSHTGKSILSLTILTMLANSEKFSDFKLIYDDAEQANAFDMEYLFGGIAASRIQPPLSDSDGYPIFSNTVQDFITNFNRVLKSEDKFVYVLDSLDSLTSDEEKVRFDNHQKKVDQGKESDELATTYGAEKAKYMSQFFRKTKSEMDNSQGILIIVSQTRDNLTAMSFGDKKYRVGGRALQFYCSIVMWLVYTGAIKNEKHKKVIGSKVTIKVDKNKYTGKKRSMSFEIYNDLGVDDVSSMVDYLIEERVFKKSGSQVRIPAELFKLDEDWKGFRKDVIKMIEENNYERRLKRLCKTTWRQIEEDIKLHDRKRRF